MEFCSSPNTIPFYVCDIEREHLEKMHVRDWLSLVFENGSMPNDRPYDTMLDVTSDHPGHADHASLEDQWHLWCECCEIFAARAGRAGEPWFL